MRVGKTEIDKVIQSQRSGLALMDTAIQQWRARSDDSAELTRQMEAMCKDILSGEKLN
jgi:hypothetical protein